MWECFGSSVSGGVTQELLVIGCRSAWVLPLQLSVQYDSISIASLAWLGRGYALPVVCCLSWPTKASKALPVVWRRYISNRAIESLQQTPGTGH